MKTWYKIHIDIDKHPSPRITQTRENAYFHCGSCAAWWHMTWSVERQKTAVHRLIILDFSYMFSNHITISFRLKLKKYYFNIFNYHESHVIIMHRINGYVLKSIYIFKYMYNEKYHHFASNMPWYYEPYEYLNTISIFFARKKLNILCTQFTPGCASTE